MFEQQAAFLLRKVLGTYVRGLDAAALKLSVWSGDVVLRDLALEPAALNALRLPVTVVAGHVASCRVRIPWKALGKEPVVVQIDRIYVLVRRPARRLERVLREPPRTPARA